MNKPGYLTTEFWLIVLVGILTNLSVVEIPDKYKWITNLLLVVGYAISRGLAKYESPTEPFVLGEAVDPGKVEEAEQKALTTSRKRTTKK